MTMQHSWIVAGLLLLASVTAHAAEPIMFPNVLVRQMKKAGDQRLVDRYADLIFDDAAQHMIVKTHSEPLDVAYTDVTKVIFEVTEHMRGYNEGATFASTMGILVPGAGIASMIIAGQHVKDYMCYMEIRQADGSVEPYVLEIDKSSIEAVRAKATAVFGERARVQPTVVGEKVQRAKLKDLRSKHKVTVAKDPRPMPDVMPDKALVVVVAQTPSARLTGKGTQIKLHANDRVVAVNKEGTWTFAYLDPGEYLLVSQADNANGLRMTLEAGKEYYFLQNALMSGYKGRTTLSLHSKEFGVFEASGAFYSDWTRTSP